MVEKVDKLLNKIFRNGSKTYYYSSLFFPPKVKEDVNVLYGFVRVADDFVDKIPQDKIGFESFKNEFFLCWKVGTSKNTLIEQFVKLSRRKHFKFEWIESFLEAMESDLGKQNYKTIEETEKYMFGSAEVIGLMMASILELPHDAIPGARLLGKAMQYINFIRDIDEDYNLGRSYLPQEINQKYGIKNLNPKTAKLNPDAATNAIRHHLDLYRKWQNLAETYFSYIPKRSRIAIKTASDMYEYTAQIIEKDPLIVFRKKVKPTKSRILLSGILNTLN